MYSPNMVTLPIKGQTEKYAVNPTKIIALGLNYDDHVQESVFLQAKGLAPDRPSEPILFPKTPNCLIGPDEEIIIPQFVYDYGFDDVRVDYEAELAVIIGKRGKNISQNNAWDYIFGYTCMNDVSQRNFQTTDKSGWFRGKSLDTFGPIGPCVVLKESIKDPQNLRIQCRLNGKTVQDSNTKFMIFSIPFTIAFVSKHFTLEEGDIIVTGTPKGVGPLKKGDLVEVEIQEIGTLSNSVNIV